MDIRIKRFAASNNSLFENTILLNLIHRKILLSHCSRRERFSHLRIGSIVIDCKEFDKMLTFWSEALHYVHRQIADNDFVILRDPDGRGPNVSLQQVPEKSSGRNWFHFDLYTNDREGEVERLLKIGATRHPQEYEPNEDFRVLEDPDGNLFCVVQLPPGKA